MAIDDSVMHTGVEGVEFGQFGNEIVDDQTKELLNEQKRILAELTPQLESIITLIDSEIKEVMSIDRFTSAAAMKSEDLRSEVQASALYKKYLDELKTKFNLALKETRK